MGSRAGDARIHQAIGAECLDRFLVVVVGHLDRDLIPGAVAHLVADGARGVELRGGAGWERMRLRLRASFEVKRHRERKTERGKYRNKTRHGDPKGIWPDARIVPVQVLR